MEEASDAECGALYENAKIGVTLRTNLEEMNWPQGIKQITIDNSTEGVFINKCIQQNDHAPWE